VSAGPIRQWRDSWLPARASTKNSDRVCYKKLLAPKAYCGRKPKVAYDDWTKVNCSECIAAHNADTAA